MGEINPSSALLRNITTHQRSLLCCVVLMLAYIGLNAYTVHTYLYNDSIGVTLPPPALSFTLLTLFWLPLIVSVLSLFLLLKNLQSNVIIVVFIPAVIVFLPIYINIFIILVVNVITVKLLRANGVKAGALGVDPSHFE